MLTAAPLWGRRKVDGKMTCVKVRILKFWDLDWYPGMAECSMIDAFGTEHRFQHKIPYVSVDDDIILATLPCDGEIRCSIVKEADGLIQIDTAAPDSRMKSLTGEHLFYVLPSQLIELTE